MGNRPAAVKQSDVTRYVKGVVDAGVQVGKIVIGKDGTVTLYPQGSAGDDGPNPCDRLLK